MLYTRLLPFLVGWISDRLLGDPQDWPHPVVWFGKIIRQGEKEFNKGKDKIRKGGLFVLVLIVCTYYGTYFFLRITQQIHGYLPEIMTAVGVFYCLAGKTLITEVKAVFAAVQQSREEGQRRLSRIVGRDTFGLSPQQIRTAALETLSENLSDGVIAPMFYFALFGLPGMMTYKMINTLDSMIGYKNQRYIEFGRIAAQLDDIANYIPARLTALLMLAAAGKWDKLSFVKQYGPQHASPNSGFPEAALAAILDCRLGGPNYYFGKLVEKPYIGANDRVLTTKDLSVAIKINNHTELIMGILVCLFIALFN